jgi:23S rRNA (adenine2503-C2)-methyltransferase
MTGPENIFDLSLGDLHALLNSWGEPDYRATQVWRGLYQHLYTSPGQFTTLPKALREKLASQFCFQKEGETQVFSNLDVVTQQNSSDAKTQKTLFRLRDGRVIETVLMAYEKRRTLCV